MNVLLFTLEYPPFHGGVANYYGNLVKHWPETAGIFVLDNNEGRLINQHWPILKWLPAIWRLKKVLANKRVGHIIVGQILPLGTVALITSLSYGSNYSVVLHGLDFTSATKVWHKKILAKMILNRAKKIICTNNYTAELVKKFLPTSKADKITAVNPGAGGRATHNAQGIKRLREKYNLKNKTILLSVGRLIKRKGFDKVIEALPKVLEKVPNLHYVIIGDGPELKNYELRIANYELQSDVIVINNATDDERDSWYDICDIFIMPARNINGDLEGFGLVYLEANLAGKPVIAGRSGGVADAVADGLNGLLVDGEKVEEISQAIINLAQDADLRRKLGQQGQERAVRDFNWPKQVKKIYENIMQNVNLKA
jgi:phosphatidylinositol alpha-1,6-mannosyltransferase